MATLRLEYVGRSARITRISDKTDFERGAEATMAACIELAEFECPVNVHEAKPVRAIIELLRALPLPSDDALVSAEARAFARGAEAMREVFAKEARDSVEHHNHAAFAAATASEELYHEAMRNDAEIDLAAILATPLPAEK